jgi:aspartyl-tRNA(Asn)/glutamyl-tRNA(Gln) amidotransferase subunit A
LSALDGIPVTIKDNLYVRGVRATWGSRLFADFVPTDDDICVERLRAAGAIVLGKTNTPEFALAGYTDNLVFGPTRNPWNLELTPGGSSGGAAASVATGMTPLAVGTDAGGSIRTPASYTGLVGVRPSNGRIPRRHGFPPMANDFQVIAPMARTVADAKLLYDLLAGPDPRDPLSLRFPVEASPEAPAAVRIRLVIDVNGEPVDPEVRASVRAAAAAIADVGYQVDVGSAPYDLEAVRAVYGLLSAAGAARVLERFPKWRDNVSENVATIGATGLELSAAQYVNALDRLARIRAEVAEAWQDFDVLCTPTAATLPWPLHQSHPAAIDGRPAHMRSASIFTTWVNAVGHPALSVPVAPSAAGIPIGMQLVGRFGAERLLFEIASRFEAVRPWADRWPTFATDAMAVDRPIP